MRYLRLNFAIGFLLCGALSCAPLGACAQDGHGLRTLHGIKILQVWRGATRFDNTFPLKLRVDGPFLRRAVFAFTLRPSAYAAGGRDTYDIVGQGRLVASGRRFSRHIRVQVAGAYDASASGHPFYAYLVPEEPRRRALLIEGRLRGGSFIARVRRSGTRGVATSDTQQEPYPEHLGLELGKAVTKAAAVCQALTVNFDWDQQFYARFGASARANAAAIVNATALILRRDLNIRLLVGRQGLTARTETFTATNPAKLLTQYLSAVLSGSYASGLYHLFSGKDLDGTAIGFGFIGGICSSARTRFSLTQYINSGIAPLVLAHEIGHGLGASHDPQGRGIMAAVISPTRTSYSSFSQTEIRSYLKNYPRCVAASSC